MLHRIPILLMCLLLAGCATSTPPNQQPLDAEPPAINSVDVVKVLPQETTIARGESGEVLVVVQVANGYHINANPPSQSYLKATELEFESAGGVAVNFISYPDPVVRKFSFSEAPLKVYEGETSLKVQLRVDKNASTGQHNLSGKLRVQACDDKVCYAPGAIDLTLPLSIK